MSNGNHRLLFDTENLTKSINIKQENIENDQIKRSNIREELFMDCDSDSDIESCRYGNSIDYLSLKRISKLLHIL